MIYPNLDYMQFNLPNHSVISENQDLAIYNSSPVDWYSGVQRMRKILNIDSRDALLLVNFPL